MSSQHPFTRRDGKDETVNHPDVNLLRITTTQQFDHSDTLTAFWNGPSNGRRGAILDA